MHFTVTRRGVLCASVVSECVGLPGLLRPTGRGRLISAGFVTDQASAPVLPLLFGVIVRRDQ